MRHALSLAARFIPVLAVVALSSGPLAAAPRLPLETAHVDCNRVQLGTLASRMRVTGLDDGAPGVPQILFVTYSNRYGFYEGMAVGQVQPRSTGAPLPPPEDGGAEHQLAFHLNPSVRELLVNPARPPLEQVSLTREASTSNLVPPGDRFEVAVRLDPTLGPPQPIASAADLVIDNLSRPPVHGEGFRAGDTKPGRGITRGGLTDICHTRFSDLDRRVFAILQRTLRTELTDPARGVRYDARIALYRGVDPETYRADIYVVDPESGEMRQTPLEARIRAEVDGTGRLTDGHLELTVHSLPEGPEVVGAVQIVRPLFGGVDGDLRVEASFPVGGPLPGAPSSFYDFDWRDVLEGTAWNEAAVETSVCGQGTAAELAATPRERWDLELLAIGMTGDLTADQAVYDRLDRDLAAIGVLEPAVADFRFLPTTDGRRLRVAADTPATFRAMLAGEYREWDCLNDWYGLDGVDRVASLNEELLIVTLEGTYNLERVAADYEELAGITDARPNGLAYPAIPMPSICASIAPDGATWRYFFEDVGGLVRYITTDPDGTVEMVDAYSPLSSGPAPPPEWWPLVEQCYEETGGVNA